MQFGDIIALLANYFDIDYRVTCVIAISIFCIYFAVLLRIKIHKNETRNTIKTDIIYGVILSVYVALLISWTVLNRSIGEEFQIKPLPFWSYKELLENWNSNLAIQIINNIVVFIPWGILFPLISKNMQKFYWSVSSACVFSGLIEVVQLVFKCGLFEFDDIFHNTIGTIIGYLIWRNVSIFVHYIKNKY